MESDEAAVKIVTIHKAKGLEYPIVIAPFLDLRAREENFITTYAYRENGEDGNYKFYCRGLSRYGTKGISHETAGAGKQKIALCSFNKGEIQLFFI